jgi:hypothetical protein
MGQKKAYSLDNQIYRILYFVYYKPVEAQMAAMKLRSLYPPTATTIENQQKSTEEAPNFNI